MNKNAVKTYAVWAREKLISDIEFKAGFLGITDKGIASPLPQSNSEVQFFDIGTKDYSTVRGDEITQRTAFINTIKAKEKELGYAEAFHFIVEQVAYTWFNRLAAIRFMEVNDFLPCRMRVLSSETVGKNEPDIVTTPFDSDMVFTDVERDEIYDLKDKSKEDELFRKLFVKECSDLHEILPGLFDKTGDYMELLLNVSYNDENSVVYRLVHDIPEADFNVSDDGQIEIIGWLYQYYNIKEKERVFANLKKNIKIGKDDIPAATQLFTPDWIVRYMVDNSLGRLWLEGHENTELKSQMKYYLDEAEQEESVKAQLAEIRKQYKDIKPEDIRFIDPCMGSGHILVYAFELLMKIYTSVGYTERDAAVSIIQNNLYGLDIDPRARQLAYFAVMMKGRQYNRRIFTSDVVPNVYVTENSAKITDADIEFVANGNAAMEKDMKSLRDDLRYADEFGSLIDVKSVDFDAIFVRLDEIEHAEYSDLVSMSEQLRCPDIIVPFVKQAQTMAQKYDVVCTNPPYMGGSGMNAKLSDFVKKNYPDSKADLFACFIENCGNMTNLNGYYAMITQPSLLFLKAFSKLREKLIKNNVISSLLHMGRGIFGVDFGSTSFVLSKRNIYDYKGVFFKLHERTFQYIEPDDIAKLFLFARGKLNARYDFSMYDTQKTNPVLSYDRGSRLYFENKQSNFLKLPETPYAYWMCQKVVNVFSENKSVGQLCAVKNGMSTTDNDRFLRQWYECDFFRIGLGCYNAIEAKNSGKKWFPYNKGGDFRKYYGNIGIVVNWENDGQEIKKAAEGASGGRIVSQEYYFRESLSWSKISAGKFALRMFPHGFLFDVGGPSIFTDEKTQLYVLGLFSSKVKKIILEDLAPTINYEMGQVSSTPLVIDEQKMLKVDYLVKENVEESKKDWNMVETSWDFKRHPLVTHSYHTPQIVQQEEKKNPMAANYIVDAYKIWEDMCTFRFNKLKANEEELNRIFIDIYGLKDELTPEVEDKDVTVRKADLQREIKSLLSYAVGCMFGRYSLDVDGLAYAGGKWDDSKYRTFIPDKDNCIPITDEAYFEDDIVGLLCGWLKKVYGAETLEENLDFIAAALDSKGTSSREKIRNYFLSDFIKDHIKIYQKRPIYWLFDSGKQNGFKALVYMHRWNADTVGNVRVEYLHKLQKVYEKELERMQDTIDNSGDNREVARASKRREKLLKQQKETQDYDAKIAHAALSRVEIDLDDGVKVNYEKVQKGKDGKCLDILTPIK